MKYTNNTTSEDLWLDYYTNVYPEGASEIQRKTMRQAFMAGIISSFNYHMLYISLLPDHIAENTLGKFMKDCHAKARITIDETFPSTVEDAIKLTEAITITVGGHVTPVKPANGKDFTLDEMYLHTDSEIIQVVPLLFHGLLLVCDEEGIMNGKMPNPVATEFIKPDKVFTPPEGMLGDVLICKKGMIE